MEYVHDRGTYVDLPRDDLIAAWREAYPSFPDWGRKLGIRADFESDVQPGA